jgi:DNA transformation protein
MPYWTIPEDAYDDPDQMARWVRLAYEAALRSPPKKPKAKKPKP